jgi:hypothetical protein
MAGVYPMTVPGSSTVELLSSLTSNDGAGCLAEALHRLPPGGELSIRFKGAPELQPVMLAQVAGHLRGYCGSASIRLLGLRERDCRLLRYLGLVLDDSGGLVTSPAQEQAPHASA